MHRSKIKPHTLGLLICLLGVLIISPDTLVVRLANLEQWYFMFWRSVASGAFGLIFLLAIYRGRLMPVFAKFTPIDFIAAGFYTGSAICFVLAVHNTTVANTLILLSTSPFFSALFGFVFLKEAIHRRTIIAIVLVFASVSLIVSDGYDLGNTLGDMLAIGAAAALSAGLTISRKSQKTDRVAVMMVVGFLAAVMCLFVPDINLSYTIATPAQMGLMIFDGFINFASFALMTYSTRFISATEVSLLLTLEAFLGSLLVWWIIHEVPSQSSLIGGVIIIGVLFAHAYFASRDKSPKTTAD